jgi:peptidoglycan/xylan/chitin deacetylase (PgdA/CDA1 family)
MNIQIFKILRKANRRVKAWRKERAGEIMSPVRRIECVAPPKERICAMTFDDGPTAAPTIPPMERGDLGLTAHLLNVLKKYDATATFDVIGSTKDNYPDKKGAAGTFSVFGTKFDHYPAFGQDEMAGVAACPDLLRRMINEGHEAANHSYVHRIFGAEYFVYRSRKFMKNLDEVVADARRLHEMVKELTGYEMTLARPPHYVDKIGRWGRQTAYDAYAKLGYNYMAASADGGGYLPTSGDYKKDVEAMVTPLREALMRDPNALSGAVIFQKDGYSMSVMSPIADALELQLALLKEFGYKIVGVASLLKESPFEDVGAGDDCLDAVRFLDGKGYCLGFKNNHFKPDAPITNEQLDAMCTLKRDFAAKRVREKTPLTADEIKRFVTTRLGSCPTVTEATRRGAVIAVCEAVRPFLATP